MKADARPLSRNDFGELVYIGARDESLARSDHDNGVYLRISCCLVEERFDSFRNTGAERVYRRIIDGDDGNVVLPRETH